MATDPSHAISQAATEYYDDDYFDYDVYEEDTGDTYGRTDNVCMHGHAYGVCPECERKDDMGIEGTEDDKYKDTAAPLNANIADIDTGGSRSPQLQTVTSHVAALGVSSGQEGKEKAELPYWKRYMNKWKGKPRKQLKRHGFVWHPETVWSFFNSLAGMSVLTTIDSIPLEHTDYVMLIGSFGATAVLLYSAHASPLAQPRNCIGGHVLSAIIGVIMFKLLGQHVYWLAASLAVALSIAVMELTGTVHPPGGATALIAVTGSEKIHNLGFMYVITPVLAGASIMVLVALILNNFSPRRSYPTHWW